MVAGLAIDLRAASTEEATIDVAADPDDIISRIQTFIDTYNTVSEFLKKATGPKIAGDDIAGSLQGDSAARGLSRSCVEKLPRNSVS